jgi:hypothetical protein
LEINELYCGEVPSKLPDFNTMGEGTPRKLATATQPPFPIIVISLSSTPVTEWSNEN